MSLIKRFIIIVFGFRLKILLNKKIRNIFNHITNHTEVTKDTISKHKQLWNGLGSTPNLKWLRVYSSVSGKNDYRYITEYDYYANVEPKLNHRGLSEAYCDKNAYHRLLPLYLLPKVLLRNINGIFYDEKYSLLNIASGFEKFKKTNDKIIIKSALDSGGGRGVELFEAGYEGFFNSSYNELTFAYLDKVFVKDYLIQEYVVQHPFFHQFNPTSLNTVRIFTYRSVTTEEIIPIHAVLRMGGPGAIVDNQASGGIAIGINEAGILNSFAVNKKGERILSYNGLKFSDIKKIPMFDRMVEVSKSVATTFLYHRLLGFDLCLDKAGAIRLIEVNNKNNEINFYQMSNGSLFGDYTGEIIEYCNSRKKTFSADFEL